MLCQCSLWDNKWSEEWPVNDWTPHTMEKYRGMTVVCRDTDIHTENWVTLQIAVFLSVGWIANKIPLKTEEEIRKNYIKWKLLWSFLGCTVSFRALLRHN